ncbi:hypothetical protein MTR67_014766 [Solanum verrucosum]|uniref:DUF7792 domain-containing protein n=1 Tax=Solanum verrucosum TaxID=315347 RepID=A0AAF0TJ82_SOLVR|nr:uncharacterized protein LOC125831388 [Solanum verrucosum]WMV21381.1 hypothetical protein MTR67_014766 [Solanum verrucosum]
MAEEEKSVQEELSLPILLADRVIKSAQEAESSKVECADLARHATQLNQFLRSTVRLTSSSQSLSLYDRPIRRITSEVTKTLERALTLVRKCRHKPNLLRHVLAITSTTDFRKVSILLENSIADVKWLLSIFDPEAGPTLSLPPIASNDPILAWVWSYIATIQMGNLQHRIDAAQALATLALDNDRNKKMIVEENGIPPLLKLLKESSSAEAQIAAATTLYNLADDEERVRAIANDLGVQIIVKVLAESPMRVQIHVANLVSRMADLDFYAQEEFGRENITRPLVIHLGMDVVLDEPKDAPPRKTPSLHSLVQINKEMARNNYSVHSNSMDGSSRGGHYSNKKEKDRELEPPEVKAKLKVSCAMALWKLAKGSLLNSRKITETKALLCLAKIIEKEKGELQINCLMTVMELAAVAESNAELRRVAFKPTSPAGKAVIDQLLRVINEETDAPLVIPAIKAIGSLARTFPAKDTRIVEHIVGKLGHRNTDVAVEACIALGKFACPDNFNCVEHSKAIVEYDGVPKLMNLLRYDRGQVPELQLLCYLALHVGNSKALEQAKALSILEGAARHVVAQRPDLRELFAKAIHHLTLYQIGGHMHRQA